MYDKQIRWGVGDDKFIIQLIEFNAGTSEFRILAHLTCKCVWTRFMPFPVDQKLSKENKHIYIYIYMCVYVLVYMCVLSKENKSRYIIILNNRDKLLSGPH